MPIPQDERIFYWAKTTDSATGVTCNVMELADGRFAYTYGDEYVPGQVVPEDVTPPPYWKAGRAQWAAYEMLRRKLNEIPGDPFASLP